MDLLVQLLVLFSVVLGLASSELKLQCTGKGSNKRCFARGQMDTPGGLEQGDMLRSQQTIQPSLGRNAILDMHKLWPDGIVNIVFHEDFTVAEVQAVEAAMLEIMNETCIRFGPWQGSGPVAAVTKGPFCYASVGYDPGDVGYARLNLESPACLLSKGLIQHELLHLVGLYHEQSRPDRDEYVKINWNNIQKDPDMSHNFKVYTYDQVTTFGLPYNYKSIMHYVNNEFASNPSLKTIESKDDPELVLGQRDAPTLWDLEKVRRMYGCPDDSFMDFE